MSNIFNPVSWISLWTIMLKETKRVARIWPETILPSLISTILYIVVFGSIMGKRIGVMSGHQYIEFVIPGLVMMSLILNSYTNVVFSFFVNKFNLSNEEIIVSPTPEWCLLLGYVSGGILRGVLVSSLIITVSALFTPVHIYSWSVTLMTVFLSSIIFCLIGFMNGLFAHRFDQLNIVPTFILTPLIYLGGVFYDIKALTGPWAIISHFNPIFYMVTSFRYGMLGLESIRHNNLTLLVMMFAAMILLWANIYLIKKGIGIKK